jgi:energy-coupling factor transport system substrate-specific component
MLILALTVLLGAWAFLYPFFIPPTPDQGGEVAHSGDAPLVFLLVVGLSLTVIIADLETRQMDSKTVALLGVLVAINSLLRPLQGPGGLSAFMIMPILCGYVFGARFGFLLGALSVCVSAIFTGGVGPWLPFQMLAMGWVGMASAALPRPTTGRGERWALAAWGAITGILFGVVMNLWFWPYLAVTAGAAPPAEQLWRPGAGLTEAIQRYAAFYVATSLAWDVSKAAGNATLIALLASPVLRLLRRFRQRFFFEVRG